MEELSTYGFIDLFIQKKIGALDVDYYIKKATDNYNPQKLSKLVIDIRSRLYWAQQVKNYKLERYEIMRAIDSWSDITFDALPGEMPDKIFECSEDIDGYWKIDIVWNNNEFEKLAYPNEFSHVHELIKEINELISKNDKVKNSAISEVASAFESLFLDPKNAQKVRDILELKGYTIDGVWCLGTHIISELICVYYVLNPLFIAKNKATPIGRVFFVEFGVPYNESDERMMRSDPYGKFRDEIERIFDHLIPN